MPIYEFRCQECSKVSEFQLKMADPHPQDCPACGRKGLKKIMSLPSFQLKGGGWYAEAYDGPSNKKNAEGKGQTKEEGATAAAPTSSSEAKSEAPAKTEAKTESKPAAAPSAPAPSSAPKSN